MAPRLFAVLAVALFAMPAQADVYKWIDGAGQVHYSNSPPPSVARMMQRMDDRLSSVVAEDRSTRAAVARMEERLARRAHYEEIDYMQRVRGMVAQRGAPTIGCGFGGYCGDRYR